MLKLSLSCVFLSFRLQQRREQSELVSLLTRFANSDQESSTQEVPCQTINLTRGQSTFRAHLTPRKHQEFEPLGPGCAGRCNPINTMCRSHKESPEVLLTEDDPQLLKTPSRTQRPDPASANTSGTSATSIQTELLRVVSSCEDSLVLLHRITAVAAASPLRGGSGRPGRAREGAARSEHVVDHQG